MIYCGGYTEEAFIGFTNDEALKDVLVFVSVLNRGSSSSAATVPMTCRAWPTRVETSR